MTVPREIKGCYIHFCERVRERVESDMCPDLLWRTIIDAVKSRKPGMRFIARMNRQGRRLWRIEVDGSAYFVVFDHSINCPVTILAPKGDAKTWDGRLIDLEAIT